MEAPFTPKQEAQIVKEDTEFRAHVRHGIGQADRGKLMDHEAVKDRIQRLLQSK